MTEAAIRSLIDSIEAYITRFRGAGIDAVHAGITAARLRDAAAVEPQANPVVDNFLPAALAAMRAEGHAALAHAIASAAPSLHWAAYDAYPRAEIGDFAERHAFASLIGEGAHLPAEDFDLGLFMIEPHTLYRDHHHAAPELYAPLTGPHGWRFDPRSAFVDRPAHHAVWNEPWQPHATLVGPVPFLCIFCWTKDVHHPALIVREA